MKKIYLLFALIVFNNQSLANDIIIGSPSYIFDGDSFILNNQQIRLQGIDAPEGRQLCKGSNNKNYKCGINSKEQLKEIINGKEIKCNKKYFDKYDRIIAECYNYEDRNINSMMVKTGFAVGGKFYGKKSYENEENSAKIGKLGIWQGDFITPYKWRKKYGKTKQYKY